MGKKEKWEGDWHPYEHAVNANLGGKNYIAEAKKDYRTVGNVWCETHARIVKYRSECGCYIYYKAWLKWNEGEWIDLGWYNFQGLVSDGDIVLWEMLKKFVEEQYHLINKVA